MFEPNRVTLGREGAGHVLYGGRVPWQGPRQEAARKSGVSASRKGTRSQRSDPKAVRLEFVSQSPSASILIGLFGACSLFGACKNNALMYIFCFFICYS